MSLTLEERRERARLRASAWYYANKERALETRRAYYQRTRDIQLEARRTYYRINRQAMMKANREWVKKNPERMREISTRSRNKRQYGLTPEQFADLKAQNRGGLCPLCRSRRATHVDHSHKSGRVRGFICHKCNVGMGMLGDDLQVVLRVAKYLKGRP